MPCGGLGRCCCCCHCCCIDWLCSGGAPGGGRGPAGGPVGRCPPLGKCCCMPPLTKALPGAGSASIGCCSGLGSMTCCVCCCCCACCCCRCSIWACRAACSFLLRPRAKVVRCKTPAMAKETGSGRHKCQGSASAVTMIAIVPEGMEDGGAHLRERMRWSSCSFSAACAGEGGGPSAQVCR